MLEHVMLDIEAMDTATTAVVLSIGAVAFDPFSNELGEKFYIEFDFSARDEQLAYGRTVSKETQEWWAKQDPKARCIFDEIPTFGGDRVSNVEGVRRFHAYMDRHGGKSKVKVWANSPDYDCSTVGSLCLRLGVPIPWHYNNTRCYRTIRDNGVVPKLAVNHEGIEHHALHDAISQAKHIQEVYACLKSHQ